MGWDVYVVSTITAWTLLIFLDEYYEETCKWTMLTNGYNKSPTRIEIYRDITKEIDYRDNATIALWLR